MVMTTSAVRTAPSVSGLGNAAERSRPISAIPAITTGLISLAGVEPAERGAQAISTRRYSGMNQRTVGGVGTGCAHDLPRCAAQWTLPVRIMATRTARVAAEIANSTPVTASQPGRNG